MPCTVVHNVHFRAGEGSRRCDANPSHSATVIHHNSVTLCHIIQFISLDTLAGINWIIIQFVPAERTLNCFLWHCASLQHCRYPRSALHKTQVSVLVFPTTPMAHSLSSSGRSFLQCPGSLHNRMPRYPYIRDHHTVRAPEFVDALRYVGALQASFAADPADALAHLQQGVPR
jgi:hypothetical protein